MRLSLFAAAIVIALAGTGAPGITPSQAETATAASYDKEHQLLLDAADRLRDAAQTAAAQEMNERRAEAIREVNDALLATQEAMAALPIEAIIERDPGIDESATMLELQQAAQRLRDATHAIAEEETGPQRNAAIKAANEALFEAQQAMIDLLPEASSK